MAEPNTLKRKKLWVHFPFSYMDELVFYTPEQFSASTFVNNLGKEFSISEQGYFMEFPSTVSLSRLPVNTFMEIQSDAVSTKITLIVSLFENNVILLLSLLLSAFLYYFDAFTGSTLSLIAGVVFYATNLHKTISTLRNKVLKIAGANLDLGEPGLWRKQQQWMKDPSVCPACGEPVNPYSHRCINCGIYLFNPKKQKQENSVNTSNGSSNIQYQIKPKHEKNSR